MGSGLFHKSFASTFDIEEIHFIAEKLRAWKPFSTNFIRFQQRWLILKMHDGWKLQSELDTLPQVLFNSISCDFRTF